MTGYVRHDSDVAPAHVDRGQIPVAALGLGMFLVAVAAYVARQPQRRKMDGKRASALVTYLREHLSGSDAAIQVVERLRRTRAGTTEGRLFGALFVDFQRERDVVRAMLDDLGASDVSLKRAVTGLAGAFLAPLSGGESGDFVLFRTLEGLAVGVQGKRLLWRAMQHQTASFTHVSRQELRELEASAVRQWEAIDARRRALVPATFDSSHSLPA